MKKFHGNYFEMIEKLKLFPDTYYITPEKYDAQINLDLPRAKFFLTNTTMPDIKTRLKDRRHIDKKTLEYTQGNFDALVFTRLSWIHSTAFDPSNPAEEFKVTYLNDQHVLCGFSILTTNALVAIAVIDNVTAVPAERTVTYFTDPQLLCSKITPEEINQAQEVTNVWLELTAVLKSTELVSVLAGVLNPDNSISMNKLNELQSSIANSQDFNDREFKTEQLRRLFLAMGVDPSSQQQLISQPINYFKDVDFLRNIIQLKDQYLSERQPTPEICLKIDCTILAIQYTLESRYKVDQAEKTHATFFADKYWTASHQKIISVETLTQQIETDFAAFIHSRIITQLENLLGSDTAKRQSAGTNLQVYEHRINKLNTIITQANCQNNLLQAGYFETVINEICDTYVAERQLRKERFHRDRQPANYDSTAYQRFCGTKLAFGIACLLIVVGTLLLLTGVLAPLGVPVIAGAAAMMCAIVAALGLAAGVKSAAELIVDEQKFSAAVDAFQTNTAVNTREQEFDTVEAEAAKILKYKPEL